MPYRIALSFSHVRAFHHLRIALFSFQYANPGEFGDSSPGRKSAMSCAHVGLLSLFREAIHERLWCLSDVIDIHSQRGYRQASAKGWAISGRSTVQPIIKHRIQHQSIIVNITYREDFKS
jgi:hypothetical protein